ncbi:MAG: DUF3592 domain-containing protein [Chloroflexota bacterium]|nr:DUF3592 domain-containing protein [Chloroflexota bacterium]
MSAAAQVPSIFQLARRSFWVLFGAIFLVAGLLLAVISAGMGWRELRFTSDGVAAEGIVLERTIVRADAGEDQSTEYRVSYRFTTDGGQVVEGSDAVPFDQWEVLAEQGPIAVEHLLGDPAQNRVAGGEDLILVAIFAAVSAIALVVGLAILLRQLRRLRHEQRLWRVGLVAEAKVLGIEQSNVTFNRRPLWHVLYEFIDAAGGRHTGRSGYLSLEDAQRWQTGGRGAVRYDPDAPDESLWVGELETNEALT